MKILKKLFIFLLVIVLLAGGVCAGGYFYIKGTYGIDLIQTVKELKKFNEYVEDIVKQYPSDKTRKTVAVGQMIKDILNREETLEYTSKEKIADIYNIVLENKPTTKKTLYGVGENGFDMDEVLNPKKDLDLNSLLKELGVK